MLNVGRTPTLWYHLRRDPMKFIFVLIAAAGSLFYGLKACEIFGVSTEGKGWSWEVHQLWFNFIGSVAGWALLWTVGHRVHTLVTGTGLAAVPFGDLILFLVAFVGVTGHLPYATMGVIQGLKDLVAKMAGSVK